MARQTPLGQVRLMVKAELAKSLVSTSTAQDSEINSVIQDIQQWLGSEFDWPFLSSRWTLSIPPSSRYISFPQTTDTGINEAIDFERAGELKLYIKWNQTWQDVNYGITEISEFNYIDSDRNQVLDPVQRWRFDDQGKFEIWPMNASTQSLRFVGQRQLMALNTSVLVSTGAGDAPSNDNWTLLNSTNSTIGTYYQNSNQTRFLYWLGGITAGLNNVWAIVPIGPITFAAALYVAPTLTGTWVRGAALGTLPVPSFVYEIASSAWNDAALLDLDDLLVTYFVCAEYTARQDQPELSKTFSQLASNRMTLVRATYPKREMPPTIVGNGTTYDRLALRIVPMVVVGGR